MKETITSVGIDIGTSTTQLIFSRLTIENLASSYTVPRISIVDKEVIYRSHIYFTPLKSQQEIDVEAVRKIVKEEYEKAGMTPDMLQTGAVIITGETARKQNANLVLEMLSDMAGDFVVATAGPDLESVLSGKGAGADRISEEERICVANVDIGGGTSNIASFYKGQVMGTSCLDIGGRLIKVENGKISYIFHKTAELASHMGISIKVGDPADPEKLRKICDRMADELAQALYLKDADAEHAGLYTNDGKRLPDNHKIDAVTFSGGVADCIYHPEGKETFQYGDIGVLLGRAILDHPAFKNIRWFTAAETIRATVVGAGTHTTSVSGSTISYAKDKLPVKNIPVLRIGSDDEADLEAFASSIIQQLPLYHSEEKLEQIAISFEGRHYVSFLEIQALAAAIIKGAREIIDSEFPLILVVENDIGKVLGNALNVALHREKPVVCIDGIHAQGGDYIDIGEPLANGRVVPVVTKTLIFNT